MVTIIEDACKSEVVVPQKNIYKYALNAMFERNHPFYKDWSDWQNICGIYHSDWVKKMSKGINRGNRKYDGADYTHLEAWMIDDIYFKCNYLVDMARFPNTQKSIDFDWETCFYEEMDQDTSSFFCQCWNNIKPDCEHYAMHRKVYLIAFIWAYVYRTRPKRSLRKYFSRLERIILSLPLERVKLFDPKIIFQPTSIGSPRHLLKQLYNKGYFELYSTKSMVERVEWLKHFRIPQEQGGVVKQCRNDSELFSDEFLECGCKIAEKSSLYDFLTILKPCEQGMMSMDHKLPDTEVEKFRTMLRETQESFLFALKDTMVQTGKELFVMFAAAATVAILARLLISTGFNIVLKLLHMVYGMIFGVESHAVVEASYAARAQSGEEDLTIPFIPSMILNYVINPPKEILSKLWNNPKIDTLMRRLGYLGDPKIERGLDRIIDWMKNIINSVYRWYCIQILGTTVPEDINSSSHVITAWNNKVDELLKKYYDGTFTWSDTTFSVVYNLYSEGLRLTREQAYSKYKHDVWKVVNKLGNVLEKFKSHGMSDQTIRNPPVTIFLSGGTGVGKSSVTYPIAAEILNGINSREQFPIELSKHWKSLIYMRSAEQEFWDGYENQLVTVFDDFNQQADSASNPNLELFEIIRASNCFPYPLHMASLEQKASTTFTSKIILVSSNLEKPKTQSLNFPEALERRFEICIRVRRIKEIKVINKFDPTVFQFERYDMSTGQTLGILSYDEFIHLCVTTYFDRKTYVDSIENYIKDKLDQPYFSGPNWIGFDDIVNMSPYDEIGEPAHEQANSNFHYGAFYNNRYNMRQFNEDIVNATLDRAEHYWTHRGRMQYYLYKLKYRMRSFWYTGNPIDLIIPTEIPLPEKPVIKRIYLNCWDGLAEAVNGLHKLRSELDDRWTVFKYDHPYLSRATVLIGIVLTSLMFLKAFSILKNFYCPNLFGKKAKAESADLKLTKVAKVESTDVRPAKVAKVESFSPVKVKVAKTESHSPKMVRTAKVEGNWNVSKTGSRNILIDNETGLPAEQGIKDINAAEILLKVARKNLYKMYESTAGAAIGHCFFLKGQVALMPKHYMSGFQQALRNDENATLHFEAVLLNRAFEIPIKDLLATKVEYQSPGEGDGPVYSRDLMALRVRTAITHSDATQYFVTKNSVCKTEITSVMLPVLCKVNIADADKAVLLLRYAEGRSKITQTEKLPIADADGIIVRYIRDAWQYSLDTRDTECGAPLIIRNTQITPGKICGIHVAGITGTGQGWSTPIYYEDVIEILKVFPDEAQFVQEHRVELKEFPKEQGQVPETADFIRLGAIEKPLAQPMVTKIQPSLCHGRIIEPLTKPCALRPIMVGDQLFDPRQYRLERLGNSPIAISQNLIDCSRNALLDEISQQLASQKETYNSNIKSVYSYEEAVVGIDGEPFINAIKRDTSSGFPFVQMKNFTRKDCFGITEAYDLSSCQNKVLQERVNNIIENAKNGIVLDHYFVDTLKDERKPLHKAHKTRLFAAGPIDYLIACKMYFNGVVALLGKNRNSCHISVGSNPYAEDWGEIARQLLRKSPYMVAGDFEGFDASEHQLLLEACGEVLIKLSVRFLNATDEDCKVMRVLLVSLFNSLHITGSEVYQWTHSLPSGHYLTAIINSLFVNISFGCVWQLAFEDVSYMTARAFWYECGIVAYGDDHIVSIPQSRLERFNQINLPELFKFIGLSYTMEDKDSHATLPSRPLSSVSFLKRKFERDEISGRWLAPLTLDTVLEFPMWMRKAPDPRYQTIAELENALRELSLHKSDVWSTWAPVLLRELEELGHYTHFVDHNETRLFTINQEWEM